MPRLITTNSRALFWIFAIFMALTVLYMARPLGSSAKSAAELQNSIARKSARASSLTGDIDRMSGKIQGLRGRISKLQRTQDNIQADLNAKAARQRKIANDLRISRDRLARLKKQLAHSRAVLAERIVAVYKQGEPNMIQVVLSSRGFADMVERTTYLERIASQDHKIISKVTRLKGSTKKETVKLAGLEKEAARLVAQVRSRRDEVRGAKGTLAAKRNQLASAVGSRKSKLAVVSKSLRNDQEDLAAMQASNGSVMGYLDDSAPIKRGTGQLIYPVNGQFTSPFGYRWGRLHGGIDLAVPVGTAVRAADSGTVRIAGWMGGYGNYICIQHSSSMSTCYGHNSSLRVSVGQTVTQGQIIAASGNTGHSTGPHVHFEVRINGTQVDPMGYL
ncbi:MAG: peptidoglycan DD-metalloendopeptidase family protein [Thermoleophilaceae bacterium]|nr:peptidoglycan DD-metalloendopeptidase family protein [Thermoleophilaceae bacterium]